MSIFASLLRSIYKLSGAKDEVLISKRQKRICQDNGNPEKIKRQSCKKKKRKKRNEEGNRIRGKYY